MKFHGATGSSYSIDVYKRQLIAFSVNIDNLDRIIFFQVLTQLRNIHIHTTGIEVVIINPDSLQSKVTLQNFISLRKMCIRDRAISPSAPVP